MTWSKGKWSFARFAIEKPRKAGGWMSWLLAHLQWNGDWTGSHPRFCHFVVSLHRWKLHLSLARVSCVLYHVENGRLVIWCIIAFSDIWVTIWRSLSQSLWRDLVQVDPRTSILSRRKLKSKLEAWLHLHVTSKHFNFTENMSSLLP